MFQIYMIVVIHGSLMPIALLSLCTTLWIGSAVSICTQLAADISTAMSETLCEVVTRHPTRNAECQVCGGRIVSLPVVEDTGIDSYYPRVAGRV